MLLSFGVVFMTHFVLGVFPKTWFKLFVVWFLACMTQSISMLMSWFEVLFRPVLRQLFSTCDLLRSRLARFALCTTLPNTATTSHPISESEKSHKMMQIVLELADEVLLETLSKKHKISEPKISLTYEATDEIFSKPCQKSTKSWTEEPFFDL